MHYIGFYNFKNLWRKIIRNLNPLAVSIGHIGYPYFDTYSWKLITNQQNNCRCLLELECICLDNGVNMYKSTLNNLFKQMTKNDYMLTIVFVENWSAKI